MLLFGRKLNKERHLSALRARRQERQTASLTSGKKKICRTIVRTNQKLSTIKGWKKESEQISPIQPR